MGGRRLTILGLVGALALLPGSAGAEAPPGARHWRLLGEAEREEFVKLFRALLDRTYLPQIKLYQGERIQFVGESVDGDFAAVQATARPPRGPEASVVFRLH